MSGTRKYNAKSEAWVKAIIADLIARRIELEYTQTHIAQLIGTSQSAISDMETGETVPGLELVIRYASAVGARVCIVDKARRS